MTAITILCPGQGAQSVGMGKAWRDASPAAAEIFTQADAMLGDQLGLPLSELCVSGPVERLNRTDVSQPAIYACSVASWRALQQLQPELVPDSAAGLSLGEYSALHLAGVFDFATGLSLVALRGRLMQQAAEMSRGGMAALIGADEPAAHAICDEARQSEVLVCANFNAPGQIVISGHATACERAQKAAESRGVRSTILAVAGAFHSPLMEPAAEQMHKALSQLELRKPTIPVWSNVTGKPHDGNDLELLRVRLVEQLTSPVRWAESCADMLAARNTGYHELAPGAVLKGLMRRIDRKAEVQNHDQP
jgi:[acyl-carrier-protein] S-malonyltransferase